MKTTSDIVEMNPNQLISWFMMASYAYYQLDINLMSDYDFDLMVDRIKKNWDKIDHPHKKLIMKTNLDAGSGYDIDFPNMVKGATADYISRI